MPVIVLAGEEEYLIWQRVKALKQKLVDPQWETFNFSRIENPDLKDVVDAAATVPFGPGNRMVLFDQCALFTKKRGGKDEDSSASKSTKLADDFDSAVKSVAANTHLVFACIANFDKSLKTSKAVEKVAAFETFPKVKYYTGAANNELITFCQKEAHKFGAYIDEDASAYLAESTEVNLRQISKEIEKAATYVLPEKSIRMEHVTLLSPHFSQVFDLMEFWALRKQEKVLAALTEMRAKQVSPHMVLAVMQTQLSKWIYYKTEHEKLLAVPSGGRGVGRREIPLKDVAQRIDPRLAFMIQKDLERIKNLSLDYLIESKQELTQLEHKVKTGQLPDSQVLDLFFTR